MIYSALHDYISGLQCFKSNTITSVNFPLLVSSVSLLTQKNIWSAHEHYQFNEINITDNHLYIAGKVTKSLTINIITWGTQLFLSFICAQSVLPSHCSLVSVFHDNSYLNFLSTISVMDFKFILETFLPTGFLLGFWIQIYTIIFNISLKGILCSLNM